MELLNKANAKSHCRTCLREINVEENRLLETMNEDPSTESKDIFIAICGNEKLQSFINKYTIEQQFTKFIDRFPQHVCIDCFKSIEKADNFLVQAKINANKLYNLFNDVGTGNAELHEEYADVDKLVLKDSFHEMESLLVHSTILNNDEAINTDPFSENVVLKSNSEWTSQNSSASNEENNLDTNSLASSSLEGNCETKLLAPKGEENHDVKFKAMQKKKRRPKKAMEKYQKQKRRPQGTKNKFLCNQCDHRFAHQFTLDVHVRKTHEGNPRPYQCEHCSKTFAALTGLTSHKQVEHTKDRITYCCDFPNCNRIYNCYMGLQYHKRTKHTDPSMLRKFICEKCGATFLRKSLLIYHRSAKHPTEAEKAQKREVFQCDVCQRTLASTHSLKYHKIKYHSGEMKFKCDVCGQRLAQKASVEYHKLLHSNEKIPCKDCGKQFVREYDLKKHVRVVHMKLKPYKCSYCPESFASNKTMIHHQFTHTGEKPYSCNLCDKSYRQPHLLKNHIKTHERTVGTSNV